MTESLLAARSLAAIHWPYFGSALWAMKLVEVPEMAKKYKVAGHIGIDKYWRLYFDPEVVDSWSIEERMGALVHELTHVLRNHASRASMHGIENHNFMAWNISCDAAINWSLEEERRLKLPGDYVTPAKLNMANGLMEEDLMPQDILKLFFLI